MTEARGLHEARIGFIGLGNIGRPMARNLLRGPYRVLVNDLDAAAIEALTAAGAQSATPLQIARECEVIGICVRDEREVASLLYGDNGLIASAAADAIIAVHSTITPQAVRQWAADAAASDVRVIDAPVTGGSHGAQARELVYMVGADAATLARCAPVFETSARQVVHAGPVGTGIALKLCLNLMTFAAFIAIKEAAALAQAAGLDPEVLYALGRSNGMVGDFNHRFISNHTAVFAQCDAVTARSLFEPFGRLGEKDLDAALATARALGLDLPATRHHRELILDTFINP